MPFMKVLVFLLLALGLLTFGCCCAASDYGDSGYDSYDWEDDYYYQADEAVTPELV